LEVEMTATGEQHRTRMVVDLTGPAPDLGELDSRVEVIDGLLAALERFDEVNRIVRLSRDRFSALMDLQGAPLNLSELQAHAVLDMPVSQQSFEAIEELRRERSELLSLRLQLTTPEVHEPAVHWFG
jgi:DNA gyrase/topoisomerase IV subunit A